MVKALICLALMFVGWIAFRTSAHYYDFLSPYTVYVDVAFWVTVAIVAILAVIYIVKAIKRR